MMNVNLRDKQTMYHLINRTNIFVIGYLALVWCLGVLSWAVAAVLFLYWLLSSPRMLDRAWKAFRFVCLELLYEGQRTV